MVGYQASDQHKFQTHLPNNLRETVLFMLIISGISVNTIPVLIMVASDHFSLAIWFQMLRTMPLLWVTVIAVVQLTHKVARSLANRLIHPVDSFVAHMLASTLCSVFVVSLILTVVGTWIGTRQVSLEPIVHFAEIWPRNFIIALVIEMFIAQPVARLTMARIHQRMEMPYEDKVYARLVQLCETRNDNVSRLEDDATWANHPVTT